MAALRRGLVDKVKKAASKVSTRGVQVAAEAGTRGARALVETTVAAVKTVDKLQQKLGRRPSKASSMEKTPGMKRQTEATARQPKPPFTGPMTGKSPGMRAVKTPAKAEGTLAKPRRAAQERTPEIPPVELRDTGRKTMPAAAPKRSKKAAAAGKQFKVKRGQKHLHSGR